MIIISAVHIKRMYQMIEDQAIVCGERSRKGSFTKIESYLVKEKVVRGGSLDETLRSPIALALVELFRRLPPPITIGRVPTSLLL